MKYVLAVVPICAVLLTTGCTQSPQKLIAAANRYHDRKQYKEASILYQKAILKDKTNAEAYYREGLNLIDQGDFAEASKYLRRAVDLKPDNADAATKLSEIYLGAYATNKKLKNLLPEVQELDNKILQHDPQSFDGLRIQGLLALANNDREKALESFEKANRIKPNSRLLAGWYAQTLAAFGQTAQAEKLVHDTLASDKTWSPGYDFLFQMYIRQNDKPKAESVLRQHVANDPKSAAAILSLGGYLVATGRPDEGESVVKRVLDDRKNFPGARQMVGDFYLREKKFDQALQQYQAGLNEDSKNTLGYQQRIVTVYEATGRQKEAMDLAKSMVAKHPKDRIASDMYASLLLQNAAKSDPKHLLGELQNLQQNNPDDGLIHLDLARVYLTMRQPDKSLSEALEAINDENKSKMPRAPLVMAARSIAGQVYEDKGDHAKGLEQAETILTSDPKNIEARFIRDRALVGMQQVDRAQPDLEALIKEAPQFGDAHLLLGNIYLSQRQYDKAAVQFDQVGKANPADIRGLLAMQTLKMAQGKDDEAIRTMQDLAAKNPGNPAYRSQLAGFEASAGIRAMNSDPARAKQFFEQAAVDYKEVAKAAPDSADAWLHLGLLQRQLGQNDAALASFEQASKADPRNASAALNEAILLESLGRKKEAVDAYNRVLGIDPENPAALNNLAFINADNGTNLDQAMTFAERAKKRAPNSPDISDTLGFVYYRKNLNSEALRIFRQVVEGNPQNPTFRLHLAMALLKQGDKQGARDEAEKAMRTASRPDDQNKIRSFVSQIG
ncbi:MAG: tetratricopeptide repeat protein [Acidobacteriaceae bacterium]|nr:tetratricopeptide repeat protein [Acidobacteriaceae bacterium]